MAFYCVTYPKQKSIEAMAAFQENHNRICPILENPASDNPILDFPIPDFPTSENPMQLNKDILNTPSFPFHIPNPSPFGGNQPLRTNFTKKSIEAAAGYVFVFQ